MPLNLCLDLGTAYSKAAAWTNDTNRPLPLRIGDAVGGSGHTVPTTVLITREGRVYFGQNAIDEGHTAKLPVFSEPEAVHDAPAQAVGQRTNAE